MQRASSKWFVPLKILLVNLCMLSVWCIGGICGCATTTPKLEAALESEAMLSAELETLRLSAEASYERERAMAERLLQAEESKQALESQLRNLQAQLMQLEGRLDTAKAVPLQSVNDFDIMKVYRMALDNYREHHYEKAMAQFAEILMRSPDSEWADNAQYWTGECHYGLGKYRQALTAFTKVFAYRKTEKADDAQLKIARCYLGLDEKSKALSSFQKLLDEYPESEYLSKAQKEMQYLQ